ncbi:MAG: S9 family peptidase [Candidatus Eremiobacteraeota bacterium]|nr:S9 family peptidase [Candidatus Eremiobacteraeota bacterium]
MEQVTRVLAAASIAGLLLNGHASAATKRKLTLFDLRQAVALSAAEISPDGDEVIVVAGRGDYEKDRNVGDLMIVNVKTRASRVLVPNARAAQVEWSPDGSRVAYIAQPSPGDEKSTPQLFVLPMNAGAPMQLTHEKNGVESFDWRPDSRALAFVSTPESKDAKAIEHHEDAFDETGESWTEQSAFQPHVLSEVGVTGGKPRAALGKLDSISGGIAYAPDGRSIYATVMMPGTNPSLERNHIVRVELADGHVTELTDATPAGEPLRSADGKYLAHLASYREFEPVNQVIVRDANASRVLWTTERLDRNVHSVAFFADDSVAVVANDRTNTRLFRVDAHGSRALTNDELNVRGEPSIARDGSVAFVASTAHNPSELYLLSSKSPQPVRLTNVNAWTAHFAIGKHETIAWKSHGMNVFGVLVYPPDYDSLTRGGKKIPLVLYIHGGPTSASTTSFGEPDVLAAHGWVVFAPNYAGSDNESIAFAGSIVPHVTSVSGPTIEDGVDAVLKHASVDPARIGVSGWSAGGMMTSWLITHDSRWKAAVDGAAVDDFLGLGYLSDSKGYLQSLMGAYPWSDQARMATYREESPATYADRVKTPTLILTDAGDYRVPTPLSYEFYHAIRATGTPVKLVVWPVVGHFPTDPVRSEDVLRQWENWFVDRL